jgi:Uma2 family endonuclease
MGTPGVEVQGDSTAKLGPKSEVQPDCALLVDPARGGRTGADSRGYTTGCPELVVEVSSSTIRLDLGAKKKVYEEAGALEYVVFDEPHWTFHWFALVDGHFEPMPIDADGLYRSRAFPGLWLDADAFLRDDPDTVLEGLRRGLASPEHAEFVERLRQNRRDRP